MSTGESMISQKRLKELLRYNRRTGLFHWRRDHGYRIKAGALAGCHMTHKDGYKRIAIKIDNRSYSAHRLVWLYVYGRFPAATIDHKNWNGQDNRLVNLREATKTQNIIYKKAARNRSKASNGYSGLQGVYRASYRYKGKLVIRSKWIAHISRNGKRIHLGSFDTAKAAHAAYCKAGRKMHGEFFVAR
jgi:hypothetical protein